MKAIFDEFLLFNFFAESIHLKGDLATIKDGLFISKMKIFFLIGVII
ncbi:hypothetical protein QNK12_07060 [Neobacillus cucumis]|nr:hypothetical protein QNK12_07060 [Neobacillus cucumis]